MRGHNEPGGGFVAGLVVAIAFIAQYMVGGTRWVEARTDLQPLALDRRWACWSRWSPAWARWRSAIRS